ncbi:MAG: nucleoside triphosphate pyrophosphohydrolase [Gemmatimonadota bacterium]
MDSDAPDGPEASPDISTGGQPGLPDHAASRREGDELLGRTLALVRHLRAHCPWDARQTPLSLRPYLLEEAHETADAVLAGDDHELAGELGDLLLNVAFQVVLAEERGAFDGPEVVRRLEAKMRDRHPHVYGDAEEAPDWEAMKARERRQARGSSAPVALDADLDGTADTTSDVASPLAGVPDGLEPVSRSLRIQQRAAAVGFDWPDAAGALDKLIEEVEELRELARAPVDGVSEGHGEVDPAHAPLASEAAGSDPRPGGIVPDPAVEEEVGDLLFAAVNVARLAGVHPSPALARATRKFEARFAELARRARERDLNLGDVSLEEMELIWREVKADEG